MQKQILKNYPARQDSKSDKFIVHSRLVKLNFNFTGVITLFAIFLMLPSFAFASPSISAVEPVVTYSDGETINISGSLFGINSAVGTTNLEFLGGKQGPIENSIQGSVFSRLRWDADWTDDGISTDKKRIATDQAHSGTKSLKTTPNTSAGIWQGTMSYQLPSSTNSLFVSFWVKKDSAVTDGQWKMLRVSRAKTVVDGDAQCFFNWPVTGGYVADTIAGKTAYPFGGYTDLYPHPDNQWYRMDVWMSGSTVKIVKWLPGSSKIVSGNFECYTDGIRSYPCTFIDRSYSYLVWQDYIGNSSNESATNIWQDDIFVQSGTQSRIELCDSVNWENSNHCEIQAPNSWTETAINITLNKGSFSDNQQVYLFEIDANGNVSDQDGNSTNGSQGYQIILGSGNSDTTAPTTTASPTGNTFTSTQNIALSANEPATIHYTLDGSTPTTSSLQYSSPINISATTTLKFFAKDLAGNVETPKNQTYTINISVTYNISNLLTLITNWMKVGTVSDVNSDNIVNTRDLGIMMSKWGS